MNSLTKRKDSSRLNFGTLSWLWLTPPVFLGVMVAAIVGFISPKTYANSMSFAAQGQGQDLVTLIFVLPLLLFSSYWTIQGYLSGRIIWLGGMLYIAYTYAIAAFQVQFNDLFLVYVVNLGCSFYGILWAISDTNNYHIKIGENARVKLIAVVMVAVAMLYSVLWITDIVSAIISHTQPPTVIADNVPTSAVEVLDLGFYLPMLVIAAVLLWQRKPLGVVISGMTLTFAPLMGVAIVAMIFNMVRLGVIDSYAQVSVFAVTILLTTALLWHLLQQSEFVEHG